MHRLLRVPVQFRPPVAARFASSALITNPISNYNNRLRTKEEQYANGVSTPFPTRIQAAIQELAQETIKDFGVPEMMVADLQAKLLHQIVQAFQFSRILEIGTFTGTSAIALASAIRGSGKVVSLDIDPKAQEVASRYTKKAGLANRVDFLLGDALESLERLADKQYRFDMVFLDGNKEGYISCFNYIMDKNLLSDRGLIIADNVLFSGLVHINDRYETLFGKIPDSYIVKAKCAGEFNEHVVNDPRVKVVALPLFDGLSIITKK